MHYNVKLRYGYEQGNRDNPNTTHYIIEISPKINGIKEFQGTLIHSARWNKPKTFTDGQTVAVIGTGASAVQIIQAIAPKTKSLTIYQRVSNHSKLGPERIYHKMYLTYYMIIDTGMGFT